MLRVHSFTLLILSPFRSFSRKALLFAAHFFKCFFSFVTVELAGATRDTLFSDTRYL